jgi:hypothetical protein
MRNTAASAHFPLPSMFYVGVLVALAVACVVPSAQAQSTPPGGALRMEKVYEATPLNQYPDANLRMKQNQSRLRRQNFDVVNAERQHQIADETAKLLLLARDLKARMEKIGDKPLSPEVLREAEIIEVLARDVEAKVTLVVGAG